MQFEPGRIFNEYRNGINFKESLGKRGMFEQNKINERFFIGDQWHGAKCGNERPLVRHNIIKRIGDYKMSQILSNPLSVSFSADGVPCILNGGGSFGDKKGSYKEDFAFSGAISDNEINTVMSAFSDYYNVTAERVNLGLLNERALRNAYITGTSVIYTYWDSSIPTGIYADLDKTVAISGDINCEVLDIENVYFGDPYIEEVQNQPYIIISSRRDVEAVIREAELFGADSNTLREISEDAEDGKIIVLTRLYKEYMADGSYTIKSIKVTERSFVRKEFDTGLRLYPLSVFSWERRNNMIYGESEITYLIPNQIAINRMITANVWATMTTGMPMMIVNGDTVTDKITNDPGQIIKVFGSNEDVAGAVKYVSPPLYSESFDKSINTLIENTLTQCGANEVALGDSQANNASALITMRDAAVLPLQIIKNRFYGFVEEISRIWADFWVTHYGYRRIKISDDSGIWYMPFDAERYRNLIINTSVEVGAGTVYSEKECVSTLFKLYEKGIIDRRQFLKRLPKGSVPDIGGLLLNNDIEEQLQNEGI